MLSLSAQNANKVLALVESATRRVGIARISRVGRRVQARLRPGVDTREDLQLMTENKSRSIFGRSALRTGAAGLTLALAASLAPGFISWSNPAPAAAAQDPIDSPW